MAIFYKGKKLENLAVKGQKIDTLFSQGQKIYSAWLPVGRTLWAGHKGFIASNYTQTAYGYNPSLIARDQNVPLSAPLSKLYKGISINLSSDKSKWLAQVDSVDSDEFMDLENHPEAYNLKQNVQISKNDITSRNWITYQALKCSPTTGLSVSQIYVRSLNDMTLQFKATYLGFTGNDNQSTVAGYASGVMCLIIDTITAY